MLTSASGIFSLKQWRHVHFSSLYSVLQEFLPSDSTAGMRYTPIEHRIQVCCCWRGQTVAYGNTRGL